jgi:putative hemolysin
MELISPQDILKAAKINRISNPKTGELLLNLLRLNKVNTFYSKHSEKKGLDFIDAIIEELDITIEFDKSDLKNIPKTGSFITISNHPYGGMEGILLLKIIGELRPDYKIIANYLLQKFEPLRKLLIPVDPFNGKKGSSKNIKGMREALQSIKSGNPIGIFPAGEVSSFHFDQRTVTDKKWSASSIKFIKKSQVPVIPIYWYGNNSFLFHFLGLIHPNLRTAKLPSELFNKKDKTIKLRIGAPVTIEDQDHFDDLVTYGKYLRARTYSLENPVPVNKFFRPIKIKKKHLEPICPPVSTDRIINDINYAKENYLLFNSGNYSVFCIPPGKASNILKEIGRLREITFREVGEGTNKEIDLDEYDLYYEQLFIWNNQEREIVGAYRIGKGQDIINQYGKKGFYINSLFHLKPGIVPVLRQSLELGRSFVIKKYQKQPQPLFLLWKGILYYILKNKSYRYLIGPVSISNNFSKLSRTLITEFVRMYYFNEELAQHVRPRKKFKIKHDGQAELLLDATQKDIAKLERFISGIEISGYSIPVLLKKYLKINARIIGFNVDPKFNNALDGLMLLDLQKVPVNTIQSLAKEFNDMEIIDNFKKRGVAIFN